MRRTVIAAAVLFAAAPAMAQEDKSVDNAFLLCRMIDGTGMASAPCEVSGWNSSVTATIDMSSGEARQLCQQVSGMMREQGRQFGSGWTFQIASPYSNGNSIAFCNL